MEELIDLIEQIQSDVLRFKDEFTDEEDKRALLAYGKLDSKCYAAKTIAKSCKDSHEACVHLIKRLGWS